MIKIQRTTAFCPLGQKVLTEVKDEPFDEDAFEIEDVCAEKLRRLNLNFGELIVRSRRHPESGGTEELLVDGRTCVVVLNNSKLVGTYRTNFRIVDAFWLPVECETSKSKYTEALCLIGTKKILFCMAPDEVLPLSLPFPIESAIPTNQGIILQRFLASPSAYSETEEITPKILSLNHPFGDVVAIMYLRPGKNNNQLCARFITSPCFSVLYVSRELDVALAFDRRTLTHSLWLVRKATASDTECALQLLDDSIYSVNERSLGVQSPSFSASKKVIADAGTTSAQLSGSKQTSGSSAVSSKKLSTAATRTVSSSIPTTGLSTASGTKPSTVTGSSGVSHSSRHQLNMSPLVWPPFSRNRTPKMSTPLHMSSPALTKALNLSSKGSPYLSPFASAVSHSLSTSAHHSGLSTIGTHHLSSETIKAFDGDAVFSTHGALPNITLVPLWNEPNILPCSSFAKQQLFAAHKAFATKDFADRIYFCYLVMPNSRLKCIQLQCDEKKAPLRTIGPLHTITACHDAEGSIETNIMIVLDMSYSILIYSGLSQVGILQLTSSDLAAWNQLDASCEDEYRTQCEGIFSSSRRIATPTANLLSRDSSIEGSVSSRQLSVEFTPMSSEIRPVTPGISNVIYSLGSSSSTSFILNLVSGKSLKLRLPPVLSCSLTQGVVRALQNVLPEDSIFELMAKWYLEVQTYNHRLVQFELPRFLRCLLEGLGFDTSQIKGFNESRIENSSVEQCEPKRRKSSKESSDASWNKLLLCEFTCRNGLLADLITTVDYESDNSVLEELEVHSDAPLFPYILNVYFAMYCCYEDLKIGAQCQERISIIAHVLVLLAGALKLHCHKERYLRELGQYRALERVAFLISPTNLEKLKVGYQLANCLGIYELISCFLRHGPEFGLPIAVPATCERLLFVLLLFLVISGEWRVGMSFEDCIQLVGVPTEFSYNIRALFNAEKANEVPNLVESMLKLMPDFYNTLPSSLVFVIINFLYDIRGDRLFPFLLPFTRPYRGWQQQQRIMEVAGWANAMFSVSNPDGMEDAIRDPLLLRRFGNEHVLREIRHFFGTCSPCKLEPLRSRSQQQIENTEAHERTLIKTLLRKLATPIARGMFTLRSVRPGCTEHLSIPKLCLCGVVLPKNLLVHAKRMELFPNILYWPRFHNGVAAALSIQPLKILAKNKEDPLDTSFIGSWLSHNLPYTKDEGGSLSPEHGGLMFGLGLNGYLRRLSMPEYHKYLIQCDSMVTSGLLLGIAAGMVGTCDLKIMKVLAPHVPFLTPPTLLDLCIEPMVQTTAIFAVGLLCAQSADLKLCSCFLDQIENPSWAARDNVSEREGYALSCGFAFGFVALGRGKALFSLPGRNFLLDKIVRMIHGGRNKRKDVETKRDEEQSLVKESRFYNTHVTAAPGIMALGMSFIRTGDASMAEWLKLPHHLEELQCIRPDAAMLRVLNYSLIMWDDIRADYKWIDTLLPLPLKNYGRAIPTKKWDKLDGETLGQIYCYAVSGAAFAMALRFIGTGCAKVIKTLWGLFRLFFLKEHTNKEAIRLIEISGRYTDELCSAVVLISLALVTAGSGHPDVICAARAHLVRYSGRTEGAFGSQLVSHMAIGLGFLGAGNYSFKVDDISIACLLCAFYPRFPMFHRDNRHHAQLLRHLYVLATERRSLAVQDSTTGSPVKATISWEFLDGVFHPSDEAEKTLVPFGSDWNMLPLPDLSILKSVHITHRHYWPMDFQHDDPKAWNNLKKLLENGESLKLCPKNPEYTNAPGEEKENVQNGLAENSSLLRCLRRTASTEALGILDSLLGIKRKPRITYADVWQIKIAEEYFRWRHSSKKLLHCNSLVSDVFVDHLREWFRTLILENVSADELRLYLTEGKRRKRNASSKVGLDELLTYYAIACPVDIAAQMDGFDSIASASIDELLRRTSVIARTQLSLSS
uniref:Anaphase-promoting complex subunit 1 middle domain-containing protein n=1 Tax=Trichuris muris TaxID=70415 RepID=A0A5S6QU22_TRIMR